jgi:hypothetical protein
MERHIRKEKDEGVNRLKKEVTLSPEFRELWSRIKPRTTYRVEYTTEDLIDHAVTALKRMYPSDRHHNTLPLHTIFIAFRVSFLLTHSGLGTGFTSTPVPSHQSRHSQFVFRPSSTVLRQQ